MVIGSGETLYDLARRHDVDLAFLIERNDFTTRPGPGDSVIVPDRGVPRAQNRSSFPWKHWSRSMRTGRSSPSLAHEKILRATGNAHKLTEFREILEPMGIAVQAPADIGGLPEVIEDGDTFEANAGKKAPSAAAHTEGLWPWPMIRGSRPAPSDWQPGVYSARYAGAHGDDAANNAKLVEALRSHE